MKKSLITILFLSLTIFAFGDKNPGVYFIENMGQWEAPFDYKANANSGAMFFSLNNFIEKNQNSNLILDFEGSNIESISRRNLAFGAKDYKYTAMSYRIIG